MYPFPSRSSLWKSSLMASSSSLPPFKNSHIARNSDLSKEPFPSETVFYLLIIFVWEFIFCAPLSQFLITASSSAFNLAKNDIFVENVRFYYYYFLKKLTSHHFPQRNPWPPRPSRSRRRSCPAIWRILFSTYFFCKTMREIRSLEGLLQLLLVRSRHTVVVEKKSKHKVSPTEE